MWTHRLTKAFHPSPSSPVRLSHLLACRRRPRHPLHRPQDRFQCLLFVTFWRHTSSATRRRHHLHRLRWANRHRRSVSFVGFRRSTSSSSSSPLPFCFWHTRVARRYHRHLHRLNASALSTTKTGTWSVLSRWSLRCIIAVGAILINIAIRVILIEIFPR